MAYVQLGKSLYTKCPPYLTQTATGHASLETKTLLLVREGGCGEDDSIAQDIVSVPQFTHPFAQKVLLSIKLDNTGIHLCGEEITY